MAWNTYLKTALPFAAMVVIECGEVGLTTLSKAAMKQGMSNLVFVVYYNALGTLILLPFFLYNTIRGRGKRVPITFSLLYKFFLLGLIGICLLQICAFTGIKYSTPTLAAALGNLIPVFTFILAVIFRMEKLDLRTSSSQAKCLGTMVAISGAMMATFYQGPAVLVAQSSFNDSTKLLSQSSHWVLGGLLLVTTAFLSSTGNILQAYTAKECPDEVILVFFYSLFGSLLAAAVSIVVERDPNAWWPHQRIEIIAILYAAISTTVFRNTIVTWCLRVKGPVYVVSYKPLAIVIAAFTGLLFLKDNLYLGSVIGSLAIAAGFYAVLWGKAREKDTSKGNACDLESTCTHNVPLLDNHHDDANHSGNGNGNYCTA